MTHLDRIVGWTVAGLAAGAIAGLSQTPVAQPAADDGQLRLAWRARPERIEQCEAQSADALAALPPHMRQQLICEGIAASYRLQVRRNDEVLADQIVRPGGLRRDRPLYVFREIAIPPGNADISITFERVESPTAPGSAGSEAGLKTPGTPTPGVVTADLQRQRSELTEAVPASLVYERQLHFAPGQVRLVSYSPERGELFEVIR